MHHVLHIQELLAIIFCYTQSAASLAALARTCQAWSDLALDILWERHGEVDHLVRFIPKRLWEETGLSRKTFDFSPTRDIPSDWGKFKKYHRRIRNVIASRTSLDTWSRFSANLPSDMVLFPRIRSLTCTCNDAQDVIFLQLFLGPSLRKLDVNISDESQLPHIQSMCANVSQTCPHLTSFNCSFPTCDQLLLPKVSNIMGDFICQYHALEYLIVPRVPLTTDAIRHIIRLPRLHTLMWSPESSSYPTDEDEFGFPSLLHYRHLETQSPRLDCINSFLSTMTLLHPNTKIRTLGVTLACKATETQVKKAFSLIVNRCDQSTLTALDFYNPRLRALLPRYPRTSDHRIKLHFDTLRPLLKFRNIQRLVLTCEAEQYGTSCVFDDSIDDDALQDMSNAWPHLTHFGLDVAGFKITFQGFLAFLKGSPNLEHVQLTADFDPSSLKCQMDELPRYPKMKNLNVKDSILKDACRTSDLFLVLFPELIRVYCNPFGGYFDRWRIVNEQMWRRWRKNDPTIARFY